MNSQTLSEPTGIWQWSQFAPEMMASMNEAAQTRWQSFNTEQQWDEAAQKYREALFATYGNITVVGKPQSPLPPNDIYVDVTLIDEMVGRLTYDTDELQESLPNHPNRHLSQAESFTPVEIVHNQEYQRFYISGRPGAGKTTMLCYLTTLAVQGDLEKIPVFISAKAWSMERVRLVDYIAQQFSLCELPNAKTFVEYLLNSGHLLFMLDGFDEADSTADLQRWMINQIEEFDRKYPRCKCLVTRRAATIEHTLPDFREVLLVDLNEAQIRELVYKWFQIEPEAYPADLENLFCNQFFASHNKRTRDYGSNPLMIILLCSTFVNTKNLPRRQVEAIASALTTVFRQWDPVKSNGHDEIYQNLPLRFKHGLFAHIAAPTFEVGEYIFQEDHLAELIEEYIHRLPPADRQGEVDGHMILHAIIHQHNILMRQDDGRFRFTHLTFHEYFTAQYISSNQGRNLNRLMTHLSDPRWREVFLMIVRLLDEADDFIAQFVKMLEDMAINDMVLSELLVWASFKAWKAQGASVPLLRAFYIGLALVRSLDRDMEEALEEALDQALDRFRSLDETLAVQFTHTLDQALHLTCDFDRARDLNLDRALDRALARTLARALDLNQTLDTTVNEALQRNFNRDRAIVFAQKLDRENARKRASELDLVQDWMCVQDLAERVSQRVGVEVGWFYAWQTADMFGAVDDYDLTNFREQINRFQSYIGDLLKLSEKINEAEIVSLLARVIVTMPRTNGSAQAWRKFAADLLQVLQTHFDLGQTVSIKGPQWNYFTDYFAGNQFLIQCLDLAIVANRDEIIERILQSPKGKSPKATSPQPKSALQDSGYPELPPGYRRMR